MAKKTQTVKNQHTVQKALLKLFSDDGLHRFEISTREWKRRSAEKATVGIYFYDMINPDGTRNQEIEHWLGKLENKVSPLIKRINEQGTELNQPERTLLSCYLFAQHYRTKKVKARVEDSFSETFNEGEEGRRKAAEMYRNQIIGRGGSEKDVEKFIANKDLSADVFYPNMLKNLFANGGVSYNGVQFIERMSWRFERIKNNSPEAFLISDCPFAVRKRGGEVNVSGQVGIGHKDSEFYFPLGSKVMLIGSHGRVRFSRHASKLRVEVLNQITIANAFKHLFFHKQCNRITDLVKRTLD